MLLHCFSDQLDSTNDLLLDCPRPFIMEGPFESKLNSRTLVIKWWGMLDFKFPLINMINIDFRFDCDFLQVLLLTSALITHCLSSKSVLDGVSIQRYREFLISRQISETRKAQQHIQITKCSCCALHKITLVVSCYVPNQKTI